MLQLDSATSLIQAAKNLMNAVVLTVKYSYVASTKYTRQGVVTVSQKYSCENPSEISHLIGLCRGILNKFESMTIDPQHILFFIHFQLIKNQNIQMNDIINSTNFLLFSFQFRPLTFKTNNQNKNHESLQIKSIKIPS